MKGNSIQRKQRQHLRKITSRKNKIKHGHDSSAERCAAYNRGIRARRGITHDPLAEGAISMSQDRLKNESEFLHQKAVEASSRYPYHPDPWASIPW